MKLTNRMQTIVSLIDNGSNVIDIGCDHALVDIYLSLYNNNKCIASDINKNALTIAQKNIKRYGVDIKTVLSNGFENINIPEKSVAIICGMGTDNIIKILLNTDLTNLDEIVIQSNTNLFNLRKFLYKIGYYISNEIVVYEKNIYYVIIKFKKGFKIISENELKYGPILLKNKDKITYEYYSYILKIYENIFNNSNIREIKTSTKKDIEFLKEIIKKDI